MTTTIEPKRYPRGTYSKIARELKVAPQTVRLVALGKATSGRIAKALAKVKS